VTWDKRGTEFSDECAVAALSDYAYRTHSEAIGWLYLIESADLLIPKRLLHKFAMSPDREQAADELVAVGFWADRGDAWEVLHHANVIRQSLAAQLNHRATERDRQRVKRKTKPSDVGPNVGTNVGATQTDRQTARQYGGELAPTGEADGQQASARWRSERRAAGTAV